jgi:hypothetical protein
MFYARVNRIKVFNNLERFPGLFDRAELQICSLVSNPSSQGKGGIRPLPERFAESKIEYGKWNRRRVYGFVCGYWSEWRHLG